MGRRRGAVDVKVELLDRDWLFGFTTASEEALRTIVGLFRENSYKTTPDDLLWMSDMPGREVWVARDGDRICAACELSPEGHGIKLAKHETASVNWIIQHTYPTSNFAAQVGLRVEHFGGPWELVSVVLQTIHEQLAEGEMRYLSIKCDIELFARYKRLGFRPVALLEPEESMRYKVLLLKPVDDSDTRYDVLAARFLRHILYWLCSTFRDVPSALIRDIFSSCKESQARICESKHWSRYVHEKDLSVFVDACGLARLRKVDPSDVASLKEHFDVVRAAALLHFGGYIDTCSLDDEVAAAVIEIALQQNLERVEKGCLSPGEIKGMHKFFKKTAKSLVGSVTV